MRQLIDVELRRLGLGSEAEGDWTSSIAVEQIPAALGQLEALRVRLLARLVAAESGRAQRSGVAAEDELLTMADVAKKLAVPVAYARELGRRGELAVVHVGPKYVRIRRSVLDAWIVQREDRYRGRVVG